MQLVKLINQYIPQQIEETHEADESECSEEQQLPGQMEFADYPGVMPEQTAEEGSDEEVCTHQVAAVETDEESVQDDSDLDQDMPVDTYETVKSIHSSNGKVFQIGDIVSIKHHNGGGCGGCTITKITDSGFFFTQDGVRNKSVQYKDIVRIY